MSEQKPTLAQVMEAINNGEALVCYARCHACMFGQCPGGWHTWADDPSDWVRKVFLLGPDPRLETCGCDCTDGPSLGPQEPDWDVDSLDAPPCPVCGSEDACGYDSEGRALIHTIGEEDAE